MDDIVQALIMAFSVLVFVIALSLSMHMLTQVTSTAEVLTLFNDSTRYYDNIDLTDKSVDITNPNYTERIVSAETIIPTLYRYYKEHFCVKIYDDSANVVQIFDVNLENKVNKAVGDTLAAEVPPTTLPPAKQREHKVNYALREIYNNKVKYDTGADSFEKRVYMFGAPWLGSTEKIKQRIDFFINGTSGYIDGYRVDYTGNDFANAIKADAKTKYREKFISYSYTGETIETEDGDELVTGAKDKDKIVIMYIRESTY